MNIDKKALGQRIKSIRQSKGLTMEEFGKFFDNASKGVISNWEKGSNIPNNARIKMIAQFGGITVNELLYGPIRESIRTVYSRLKNGLFIPDIGNFENDLRFDMLYSVTDPSNSPIFNVPKQEEDEIFRLAEEVLKEDVSANYYPNEDYIATTLVLLLTKRYREVNRNNQNNIKIALTELINLKEKIMHRYFVDNYSIDDDSDSPKLVLKDGFDEGLYYEMNSIFNEAIDQLSELQNKYPDKKEN